MLRNGGTICRSMELVSQAVLRSASTTSTGGRIKTFEIYRFDPEKPNAKPYLQVFHLTLPVIIYNFLVNIGNLNLMFCYINIYYINNIEK